MTMIEPGRDIAALIAEPRYVRLGDNLIGVQFPLMKLAPAKALAASAPAGAELIETSSGTMGLALAMVAAAARVPLTLVTPILTPSFKRHLEALGQTRIVEVTGGQAQRLEQVHAMLADKPTLHFTNQYANQDVPRAYAPFGSVLANLGVGAIVAAVGSGGSASGLIGSLRKDHCKARLVVVDVINSVLFGRPDGPRVVPGIGNSILPPNLDHSLVDEVHWLADDLLMSGARSLARDIGLFVGPTSAGALKVARWCAMNDPSTIYAAILPDEGHRYLDTVFIDQPARTVNAPVELGIQDAQEIASVKANAAGWLTVQWAQRRLPMG